MGGGGGGGEESRSEATDLPLGGSSSRTLPSNGREARDSGAIGVELLDPMSVLLRARPADKGGGAREGGGGPAGLRNGEVGAVLLSGLSPVAPVCCVCCCSMWSMVALLEICLTSSKAAAASPVAVAGVVGGSADARLDSAEGGRKEAGATDGAGGDVDIGVDEDESRREPSAECRGQGDEEQATERTEAAAAQSRQRRVSQRTDSNGSVESEKSDHASQWEQARVRGTARGNRHEHSRAAGRSERPRRLRREREGTV